MFDYRGTKRRRGKGPKKISEELLTLNFSNMEKIKQVNQIQEAQRAPGRINPRQNTPRHTVIKLTKINQR